MKKIISIASLLLLSCSFTYSQTSNKAVTEHDPQVKTRDSLVKFNLIDPAEKAAEGQAADWAALSQSIMQKYDALTADRTLTKAKIYYYYSKDWPQFCAGIVHYTDNFELADDYKLLNLNAGMILKNSVDKAQLKEALKWSQLATAGDPGNGAYQATFKALQDKINQ